jgi:hypothetical protein
VVDFFNEVDEDLRGQQTRELIRKWLPWALGGVAAIVLAAGGWWGWEAWRTNAAQEAAAAYDRGLKALAAENAGGADAAFAEAATKAATAYKALALMQRGGLAIRDDKREAAIKFFDEAARVARSEPIIADAAALKAAYILMDTATLADIEKRLKPLAEDGRPYRPLAMEALAMAKLYAGKVAEARSDMVALSLLLDAPEGLRQRSQATIQSIDAGTAPKLPAIARAAMELPTAAPAANPFAPPAGARQPQAPQTAPAGAAPQ